MSTSGEAHVVGRDDWLGDITVGGQLMSVIFDTGSINLIVKEHSPEITVPHAHCYDRTKSPTFRLLSTEPWASFGKGNIVGSEHVGYGDLVAPNQTIFVAREDDALLAGLDGIMGLGAPFVVPAGALRPGEVQWSQSLLENLAGQLARPVLSVDLHGRDRGTFTFGSFDESAFHGPLTTIPILHNAHYWSVAMPRFQVGSGPVEAAPPGQVAIVDSGSNAIGMPAALADKFWSQVPGAHCPDRDGFCTYPCGTALPDLHLGLAPGYMAWVPGKVLEYRSGNTCQASILRRFNDPKLVLGVPFFYAQYVVLNAYDRTVSFSDKVNI